MNIKAYFLKPEAVVCTNRFTLYRAGAGVYIYVGFGFDTGFGFGCMEIGHTGYLLPIIVQLPAHRKGETPSYRPSLPIGTLDEKGLDLPIRHIV